MQMKTFSFTASDGCELFCYRWTPDPKKKIKGVIQLHHGMAEHALRYDRFGSILSENGYVLNAYDVRGHGRTAEIAEKKGTGLFGKLSDKNGFDAVTNDLSEMINSLRDEYKKTPVFLIAHSFGSFVAQNYIESEKENVDGCILIGTAGPRPVLMTFGKIITGISKFIFGKNARKKFVEKISFAGYLNHIKNPETSNDWLSRNKLNVQMYNADQWCGQLMTTSFFYDMVSGLKKIHTKKNIRSIRKNLPVMFLFGDEDPVGGYGQTIRKLKDIYIKNGMTDVSLKSFPENRHEILNEDDREEVEKTILEWLKQVSSAR
ncbi:MAG: alpha/beta hydrolase [Treponema sp.]|nr:alpha/beta hydrolase [Treponema sp.]